MKANPMGIIWMIPAGWLNDLPGAASRTLEALPERYLTHGMNIYTLLDDAVRGFGGAAAVGWAGETDQQRQLPGVHHPGGKRRLFGVGEGPTEAVAGAKQETVLVDNGSTQAGMRNKMRNSDLRFGCGHASVALRSPS